MKQPTIVGNVPTTLNVQRKSRLTYKERASISKELSGHSYLLDSNRVALDVIGIKKALATDNEGVMTFIDYCKKHREKDVIEVDGAILVHRSAVIRETYNRIEQPRKLDKTEKFKCSSAMMIDSVKEGLSK